MIEAAKESFLKQGFMKTLGAEIIHIEKGLLKIRCKKHEGLTQQHGFFHAGVLTSIMDVACGYAALTTMQEGSDVLSVEFKTNLLRPAKSDVIIATGHVVKSGRTLVFCEAKVTDEKEEILYTTMQGTMISLKPTN
ncbi:PaaI family thioesterase [Tenacibaculum aiptasiae]|uniref:PaaI family thioesterase n=2 Tax=Tenacibaculum aiptasiae TaxID=426481 RepID=A0A7J5AAL9_9FLAO|nr:PaaI family thioesterase [Tenacibaculum aiptasiae]